MLSLHVLPFVVGAVLPFVVLAGVGLALLSLHRFEALSDRLLLAPAVGMLPLGLGVFLLKSVGAAAFIPALWGLALVGIAVRAPAIFALCRRADRLAWVAIAAMFFQAAIVDRYYAIYAKVLPGPDPIWTVYRQTGTTPPDQMFAWHQALFFQHASRYGETEFLDRYDLYDRPHFSGYLTLFFVTASPYSLSDPHLAPLPDQRFHYDYASLAWYRSLWWMLNSLYLLGVVALVRSLLGARAAYLALALTLLSAHVTMATAAVWVKFASVYPLALAAVLVLRRRETVLAALLAAVAFHLHGSTLAFILGLGTFAVIRAWRERKTDPSSLRRAGIFVALIATLIAPWFIVPPQLGSRLPLAQYYLYDAGVIEAQTVPRHVLRERFYASAPLENIALLPTYNVLRSLFPVPLFQHIDSFRYRDAQHLTLRAIATALAQSQIASGLAAAGVWTLPLVLAGVLELLRRRRGRIWLACAYFLPTLYMAFVYRKDIVIRNQIISGYHLLALVAIVYVATRTRPIPWHWALLPVAYAEWLVSLFFGQDRFSNADAALSPELLLRAPVPLLLMHLWLALALCTIWRAAKTTAPPALAHHPAPAPNAPSDAEPFLLHAGRRRSLAAPLLAAGAAWCAITLLYALVLAVHPP